MITRMKRITQRVRMSVTAVLLSVILFVLFGSVAHATDLDELSAGVATILDPRNYQVEEPAVINTQYRSSTVQGQADSGEQKPGSDLAMANVQNVVNVRSGASEDSDKVGLLYKDCGGKILERKNGWTKLQSGDLTGWVKDEYLLFDEEARSLADEVGNLIVTINTDALRVRKDPDTDAGVYGVIAQDDELEVVEVVDDDWISVDYDGKTGYVSSRYVALDFHIDSGETITSIKAREKAEAEAKAKLTANQGAVVANADDTRLLAALIQCEAGNEPYEGQVAVGAVVMNRVRSGAYPNSITGVIYASGQFPPALNGKVARVYQGNIKESCVQAAQEALNGATNVGTATHFKRVGKHDGLVINNHVFW